MKVLFDHPSPFLLAHGGFQIQIEQTYAALQKTGVEVEYLRWWDDTQRGDIIHYFGRPTISYVEFAQRKGLRVLMAQLLTGLGSRPRWILPLQKMVIAQARKTLPSMIAMRFGWDAFQRVDACVALTEWEAHLMNYVFGAPKQKLHVIPNGVEEIFLKSNPVPRGQWLVCTATITERKRVLELAEAAVRAKAPLWILGKPYAETDPYAKRFFALARQHSQIIRYEGAISDRAELAQIYRQARGFVLLSTMESLSLSALEATACECPLLLSDLPWARTVFGENASYCPIASPAQTAQFLHQFHDAAPSLKPPSKPATWIEVAQQLKTIYASLPGIA